MTTQTHLDDRQKIDAEIAALRPGRRYAQTIPGCGWIAVSLRRGTYVVATSWETREGYDDDYGSCLCGCPYSRTAHRHWEYRSAGREDAATAFGAAIEARRRRISEHGLPDSAMLRVE